MPILQVGAVMGKDVAEEKGLIKSEEDREMESFTKILIFSQN